MLAASDINVHSKIALKYMFYFDPHCYNVEVSYEIVLTYNVIGCRKNIIRLLSFEAW